MAGDTPASFLFGTANSGFEEAVNFQRDPDLRGIQALDIGVDAMFRLVHITEDSAGFTLIEVVIASLIITIGVMGSYALFNNVQDTSAGNSAAIQAQQEARLAMERMARELRESSAERIWTHEDIYFYEPMVMFLTPKNDDRTFAVNESGEPEWQQAILYILDMESNSLHKYKSYDSYILSALSADEVNEYEVYEWVYQLKYGDQVESLGG